MRKDEGRHGVRLALFEFVKGDDLLKFLVKLCHHTVYTYGDTAGESVKLSSVQYCRASGSLRERSLGRAGKGSAVNHRRFYFLLQ